MKNNKLLVIALLILLTTTIAFTTHYSKASPTPNLHIEPASITAEAGKYFTVNISIADVSQLAAWQLKLYYNHTMLNGTFSTEGPFLREVGATFYWQVQFNDQYNATHGILEILCSITGGTSGANGSGTLASVIFMALSAGNGTLHLEETKLIDPAIPNPNPIVHTTTDGAVQVVGKHDIAVTSIVPFKTIVGQGYNMYTNVTVKNQGTFQESFDITLCANATPVQTKSLNLAAGTSITTTFTWNTTGFAKGSYRMSAYATRERVFTDGWVTVSIIGDVDGNSEVDIFDITAVCMCYGSKKGEPLYHADYDLDNSGEIDIFDVTAACINYGQKDP